MDCLPNLEIQDDLDNLEEEDEDELVVTQIEDLSIPREETFVKPPEDIFVGKPTNGTVKKPVKRSITPQQSITEVDAEGETPLKTKRKKPLSEKQKAHLERARIKAAEAKMIKQLEKQAIKERIAEEMKAAKAAKKKVKVEPPPQVTEDFKVKMNLPTAEEQAATKKKTDENQFMDFMSNMEKFQRLQYDHQEKVKAGKRAALAEQQKKNEIENRKKKVTIRQPQQIPAPHPQPNILKPPSNPYSGAFDW
tara:strand:+ start:62 stop:811 length:750 start_codon:yes stop_codon:yes gene_type:complete